MSTSETNETSRRRGRPARARSAPLDRTEILAQAHAIVSADGLDGLNMRRLADELGVTPMALYNHVANKRDLLYALVADVWRQVEVQLPAPMADIDEWIVQCALTTRRVWLDHPALVNLSLAVAPADDSLVMTTGVLALALEAAGYPDVPLAAGAIQNFLLGSVATWSNRRIASAYFERDPNKVLAQAERLLAKRDATPNHFGVLRGRFDVGDEANFEPAFRALLRGLHEAPPAAHTTRTTAKPTRSTKAKPKAKTKKAATKRTEKRAAS